MLVTTIAPDPPLPDDSEVAPSSDVSSRRPSILPSRNPITTDPT